MASHRRSRSIETTGISLELHLIGSGDGPAIKRMRKAIHDKSSLGAFTYYHGHLSHSETLDWYNQADLFAFASSCETFGIIFLRQWQQVFRLRVRIEDLCLKF